MWDIRLAVLFLALAGVADMVSKVFRGTILQAAATDDMRGRIGGAHGGRYRRAPCR